jgi:hypothetical protein
MPPRRIVKKVASAPLSLEGPITQGGGMTAGLEIWRLGPHFVLRDTTPDERFAADTELWNTGAGLNDTERNRIKYEPK